MPILTPPLQVQSQNSSSNPTGVFDSDFTYADRLFQGEQINTATQILHSTRLVLEEEFSRAYLIMKKVVKGKLDLEKAILGVETSPFDNTYQFVIKIEMITTFANKKVKSEVTLRDWCRAHARFVMTVEVRLRNLLV